MSAVLAGQGEQLLALSCQFQDPANEIITRWILGSSELFLGELLQACSSL